MEYYFVAHRGWSGVAPENTRSAFQLALDDPHADIIECDIQLTKDGKLVVFHDFSLERTSNGVGPVFSCTYEELLQYDYGSWFSPEYAGEKIMLFSEILSLIDGKKRLMVELKTVEGHYDGILDKLLKEIENYPKETLMIESFNHCLIHELKQRDPKLCTGIIYYGSPTQLVEQLKYQNCNFVSIQYVNVTKQMVEDLFAAGMEVVIWTLNHPWQFDFIAKIGTGLIVASDYPGLGRKHLM